MTLQGSEFKKAALLGLMVAVLPLFLYPHKFGLSAATHGTASLFLFEPLYYAAVLFATSRYKDASRIIGLIAVGMGFRLCVGLISATLMTGIFGLSFGAAFQSVLFAYLPGAISQMAFIPFIVNPLLQQERRRRPIPMRSPSASTGHPAAEHHHHSGSQPEVSTWTGSSENLPDFNAAVSHIASYGSVEMAMLVDHEGLPLARACRGGADWELWSPVVNRLHEAIKGELQRTEHHDLHQFDLLLDKHHRLTVIMVRPFYLCVLYDHTTDDLVSVRIAQAVEMVKRYREHKYPKAAPAVATEVAYV